MALPLPLFTQVRRETVWKVLTSPKNRPYETAREDEEAPFRWLLATNTCTWDAL